MNDQRIGGNPNVTRIVVGYARVSTNQDTQTISTQMQITEFKRLKVDHIIAEPKSASRGLVREGWQELRVLVAQRRVRTVLVADLSRLARDGSDMDFLEECAAVGTEVRDLLGQTWENQTIGGMLSAGVTSLMNRVQSRMIGVKAADGLRRRRDAGFLARGIMPFGYTVVDSQPAMHPEHWMQARWVFDDLLERRMNIASFLKALPPDFPWQPTTGGIHGWIRNPMLRGGIGYKRLRPGEWEHIESCRAPQLISQDEYDTAVVLLRARRNAKNTTGCQTERLYTSMICCMGCGHNMNFYTRKKPTHACRYQCKRPQCKWYGKTVREDAVTTMVTSELCRKAKQMAEMVLEEQTLEVSPEEARLRDQLRHLEQLDAQGVDGLRVSICRLRDQIAVLRMAPLEEKWLNPDYQLIFSDPKHFELTSPENFRPVVVQFVSRIEYRADDFSINVILRH